MFRKIKKLLFGKIPCECEECGSWSDGAVFYPSEKFKGEDK